MIYTPEIGLESQKAQGAEILKNRVGHTAIRGGWSRVNAFFLLLLALLVILIIVFVVGAFYVTRNDNREREERSNESRQRAADHRGDSREFYKSVGLGTGEQVKIRLFTPDEYRDELGGDIGSFGNESFMGALKTYRNFDDEWYETSPEKVAEPLDLKQEDYRMDEEHRVLLLKKLPPGLPISARDHFDS